MVSINDFMYDGIVHLYDEVYDGTMPSYILVSITVFGYKPCTMASYTCTMGMYDGTMPSYIMVSIIVFGY